MSSLSRVESPHRRRSITPGEFEDFAFREKLNKALDRVQQILHVNRHPERPEDVPHKYGDKYLLAEMLVKVSTASALNVLQFFGLTKDQLELMRRAAETQTITLRFKAKETCSFVKSTKKQIDSKTKLVTEVKTGSSLMSFTSKTVTTFTEYTWRFTSVYELLMFAGPDDQVNSVLLGSRTACHDIITTIDKAPRLESFVFPAVDVNVTWLLSHVQVPSTASMSASIAPQVGVNFSIDRGNKDCHTPRRNPDVEVALDAFWSLRWWAKEVMAYLEGPLFSAVSDTPRCNQNHHLAPQSGLPAEHVGRGVYIYCDRCSRRDLESDRFFYHCTPCGFDACAHCGAPANLSSGLPISSIGNDESVFVPVVALFEDRSTSQDSTDLGGRGSPSIAMGDAAAAANDEAGDNRAQTCSFTVVLPFASTGAVSAPTGTAPSTAAASAITGTASNTDVALQDSQVVLSINDMNAFLAEECRSLIQRNQELAEMLPAAATGNPVSAVEGTLLMSLKHLSSVVTQLELSVDYVEDMLRQQLISAIGKIVTASDFSNYMRFHYLKIFRSEYQPRAFSYPVRRSDQHSPEGTISIEEQLSDGSISTPIESVVCSTVNGGFVAAPMHFEINASTKVTFGGERYLHAWLSHTFSNVRPCELSLVSRARQFSSFIVLVGRIASATLFQPKYGIIVQNKDEVTIPLDLETIPTPKEFRDAIESLSPEQQRFAKAYRGMQLESTLFGVCVIQIKPQLEKLLNLAPDSLTKEIQLTQDLMELLMTYQIPSDLLSFDGDDDADANHRISCVRRQVQEMQAMIDAAKKKEIEERRREEEFRRAEEERRQRLRDEESSRRRLTESAEFQPRMRGGADPMPHTQTMMKFAAPMGAGAFTAGKLLAEMRSLPPPGAAPPPPTRSLPPAPTAPTAATTATTSVSTAAPKGTHATKPTTVPESSMDVDAITTTTADVAIEFDSLVTDDGSVDFTRFPAELDRRYEQCDVDSALRPTIINPGDSWTKKAQKALLSGMVSSTINTEGQKQERNKTFDLLDALSRSGGLPMEHTALHVVIAATHSFDKSLLETVVQDNINPIEKAERSTLIMGTTLFRKPAMELLRQDQVGRVSTYTPQLFLD